MRANLSARELYSLEPDPPCRPSVLAGPEALARQLTLEDRGRLNILARPCGPGSPFGPGSLPHAASARAPVIATTKIIFLLQTSRWSRPLDWSTTAIEKPAKRSLAGRILELKSLG
jgi:hypothetical protein